MKNKTVFTQRKLALLIAATSLAAFNGNAMAQTNDGKVEEIIITGIKGSLIRATDIKREASGVVDAISSEDLGKMPDTNLAESLQRISGVSIDRSNNEGSRVTVRGFGPEFNLVTLNGRQMPTAQVADGNATTAVATRSFDFSNLASESVNGVEVYKTGRADASTGGIGSLINIKTARPLDSVGLKLSLGAKAVMDTSNVTGRDVTPEISGLISDTFADDKFGVALSFAHQERDSREQNAKVTGWLPNQSIGGVVTNENQNPDGNTWYPRDTAFDIGDISRTRNNGQLTLQYAPTDDLKATVDYTYSNLISDSHREAFGLWFINGGATNYATINKHGTVIKLQESSGDFSTNESERSFENKNKSLGLNLDWKISESVNLNVDYHDSSANSEGRGYGNDAWFVMGDTGIATKDFDVSKGLDIPQFDVVFQNNRDTAPQYYDGLFGKPTQDYDEGKVKQFQLKGEWKNLEDGALESISFGGSQTDVTNRIARAQPAENLISAGSYGGNQSVFDDNLFTERKTHGLFTQFSGGGKQIIEPIYYAYDFKKTIATAEQAFNSRYQHGSIQYDDIVEEDTTAIYTQFKFESDFNQMPVKTLAGLRYETTTVDAKSLEKPVASIRWKTSTEWEARLAKTGKISVGDADYDVFLPSLDTSLEFEKNLIGRLSYSKSITRNDLTSIRPILTPNPQPKLGNRTASQGNPALKPYTADNLDISLEYYFDDSSYLSAGFFAKQVENFLQTTLTHKSIAGTTDPYIGPRAKLARDQLIAAGSSLSDANIYNQMIANGNGGCDGVAGDICGASDDPLMDWTITVPTNGTTLSVHGVELAAQYLFGESGFGLSTNLTFVKGDTSYDVAKISSQSALLGLSDTANLVGFYEKDAIQVRVAYNWRDEFLSAFTQSNSVGEPVFTEAYGQFDANASYKITDQFSVFVEGTNLTNSVMRLHGRYKEQFLNGYQYGPRYNLGLRYTY